MLPIKHRTRIRSLPLLKNDYDEHGNPVERYSVAKQVTEMDYEHGNGMTYNPNTNEILIVGSTPLSPENQGYVYIVDADTLKFKKKVHEADHNPFRYCLY